MVTDLKKKKRWRKCLYVEFVWVIRRGSGQSEHSPMYLGWEFRVEEAATGALSPRLWCSALIGGEGRAQRWVMKSFVGKYSGCEQGRQAKWRKWENSSGEVSWVLCCSSNGLEMQQSTHKSRVRRRRKTVTGGDGRCFGFLSCHVIPPNGRHLSQPVMASTTSFMWWQSIFAQPAIKRQKYYISWVVFLGRFFFLGGLLFFFFLSRCS